MKYKKKPVTIEAITFDELVQHGIDSGAEIVNGMPWSFDYKGQAITHETDQSYVIPTLEGNMLMGLNDMLITGVNGEIYPCKIEIFDKTYECIHNNGQLMSFGQAIDAMKDGEKVARSGWNGKNMFIVMMPPLQLPPYNTQEPGPKVNDRTAKFIGKDKPLDCQPYIAMYNAQEQWIPGWVASQSDMLSDDWYIVE